LPGDPDTVQTMLGIGTASREDAVQVATLSASSR
jgi:hypothetical protein